MKFKLRLYDFIVYDGTGVYTGSQEVFYSWVPHYPSVKHVKGVKPLELFCAN